MEFCRRFFCNMAQIGPVSNFQGLGRWPAFLIAFFTLAMIVCSIGYQMPPAPPRLSTVAAAADPNPDLTLYHKIIGRISAGEAYYPAAAKELRAGNYPLRPFIAFRLPTLAVVSAAFGEKLMIGLNWLLICSIIAAWWVRLGGAFQKRGRRLSGTLLVISGLALMARPGLIVVHEVWAGLFIALALAIYRPYRWWPSVLAALIAVMIRETALPFILLMGAFAVWNRSWREVLAWSAIVTLFAIVLGLHAEQVAAVTLITDAKSPGWTSFGGWPFFVLAIRLTTALRGLPVWMAASLIPLAMLGWASWRSRTGLGGFLLFSGYALILMTLGRPDNFYWGLMVAPTFLLGLAFLPNALSDLWRSITSPAGST
jgi:hypothetical protein